MFILIYRLGIFSLKRWRDYTIHLHSLFLGALHIWMCVYLSRYSWFWSDIHDWPSSDTPSKHTASSPHCCLPTHRPPLLVWEKANHCNTEQLVHLRFQFQNADLCYQQYLIPTDCFQFVTGAGLGLPYCFSEALSLLHLSSSSLLSCQQFWALTFQWTEHLCSPQIHMLNPKHPV